MKITNRGIEITEVPNIHKITVEQDGSVVLDLSVATGSRFTADEWRGFSEAVSEALIQAWKAADARQETEAPAEEKAERVPRVWDFDDLDTATGLPAPAAVRDRHGTLWTYLSGGRWRMQGGGTSSWGALLSAYGPLTEVIDE